jgi:alkylation response protein AidB-like acyl-CoA dehydrogenase
VDLDFTADQEELRDGVRQFLGAEVPISLVRQIVEAVERPTADGLAQADASVAALWASMVALDWPALAVPEAHGGMGLGAVEVAVVAEELGRVIAPGPWLATATQLAPLVRELGDDAARDRFLGAIASGSTTGTIAIAEATGSWKAADVTATATPDGDSWVLHGTKCYVQDGDQADEIGVVARLAGTTGSDGVAAFVVPRTELRVEPLRPLDKSRHQATVHLDGVRVGPDRVLGTPGACAVGVDRAVQEATVAIALEVVGLCQSVFDMTLDYAKQRVQFDVPIGSFQAIKHKFADLYVQIEKARAAAYFASATLAEDDPRRAAATAMAKAAAGDAAKIVAKEGIQIHGGIGFTWEHDAHLYIKRIKSDEVVFGTASTHRQRVAELIGVGPSERSSDIL